MLAWSYPRTHWFPSFRYACLTWENWAWSLFCWDPTPATSSPQHCIVFADTSLSLYNRSLFIFPESVTGSTADSWHTSRWHLHTEASLCADKLSAHSENRSGLHLLRKASLHRGHSSVLLYYKNTQSKYFHEQLEGSKTYTANVLFIQKGNTENKTNPSYGGNLNIS